MSEELVVRQCAPTLAGIKTGSLFSCPCDSPEELRQEDFQLYEKARKRCFRAFCVRVRRYRRAGAGR